MNARFRMVCGLSLVVCAGLLWDVPAQTEKQPKLPGPDYKFSGPFTHENLTIFLIHGEDRLKGRKFMMLAEALEKKTFVIHETKSVNQLTMENLSDEEVLILSGDILKGGQQDRVAQFDQIVPPKSGKVPLTVFCVERTADRWGKEPTEKDKTFHSSPGQICTSALRLANRHKGVQGEVWQSVVKAQEALSTNAGAGVKDKASDSSLALSLKVKEVQAAVAQYVTKLETALKDKDDVVGFAFAINGKVYAADIYALANHVPEGLPRLLHASAVEAFAEVQKDKTFATASVENVKSFLAEADKGKATDARDVGKTISQSTNESERVLRFDSKDNASKEQLRQELLEKIMVRNPAAPSSVYFFGRVNRTSADPTFPAASRTRRTST